MNETKKYIFGVDVGGTSIKLGMFDENTNLIDKCEFKTPITNVCEGLVNAVNENILALLERRGETRASIIGVGMGLPSSVEYDGYISDTTNLDLVDCNPGRDLSLLLDTPVFSENDANVAALGEFAKGAAQGYSNVVMITLGTGLGGGIIWNGKLLRSPRCGIGEIGHIRMEKNEKEYCGCGRRGCLEQYASATGIVKLARDLLKDTDKDSALRNKALSAKAVFDAAKAGDEIAGKALARFGDYLGLGLADTATILDPDVFVIGGGVSKAGDMIIDLLTPAYLENSTPVSKHVKFKIASLGNDAGIYGAAAFVKEQLEK